MKKKDATKPADYRLDAQVWHLYLEDAEREAKERVELWKTNLDSLLIFVSMTFLKLTATVI
jgi:hypothetical protein